ncbi:Carboxypeptidase regulatory-like domain protein [Candidatus Bilamarchaeum dharawalense]|uniref:Carboxypeptidase regulatory-like domain protein n=1 Tax=Candidatus Bilamarchaeum dharawalense TaxID=2885759 RepID=A0A5E4LLW8_9ARCH|nr:Carboxypeptidase regulatory-like domain protein [Candidatus Bilamarchaeum dharawalense]
MKKLILLILLGFLFSQSYAFNQTDVCYSQCAAWKLTWQDDYCWAYIEEFCSMSPTELSKEMVSMWADFVLSEVSFQTEMQAFLCADVITDCIAPKLDACRASCAQDNLSYAPNLYVNEDTVYYDEDTHQIHVVVKNGGRAYIRKAYVSVSSGDSSNLSVTNFKLITNKTLEGMRPFYVRYSPVGFNESERGFVLNYEPKKDRYNIVRIVVTTEPGMYEMYTHDNTYDLVVNDLPAPAYVRFANVSYYRNLPKTNDFIITPTVENQGEVTGNVVLNFYYGSAYQNTPAISEPLSIAGDSEVSGSYEINFPDPVKSYMTLQITENGQVIDERTIYPDPQYLHIQGKITDETGRPIEDAIVSTQSASSFPLTTGAGQAVYTDESGNYELYKYIIDEGTVSLYVHKPGYSPNSTVLVFSYDAGTRYSTHRINYTYIDLSLLQNPATISINYPSNGWYIIETDKGRFAGIYAKTSAIPIRGNEGTVIITSQNCSPFVSDFDVKMQYTNITVSNVSCLTPDANDDYTILSSAEKVFEKNYEAEEPRDSVFSRNGNFLYVTTAKTGNNRCTLYSYSLPDGNQIYKHEFNDSCAHYKLSPSYDGSVLYFGFGAGEGSMKGGDQGHYLLFSQNGSIIHDYSDGDKLDTLEHSSATELSTLVGESPLFYVFGYGLLEPCMLIANKTCDPPTGNYALDVLGLSKNRALGKCNKKVCIFTLGAPDYVELDKSNINNPIVSGNYKNNDVFIANYEGGSYYSNGVKTWEVDGKIKSVSMSPGGKFIILAKDPYGVMLYSSDGQNFSSKIDQYGVDNIGATERGVFYTKSQGKKLEVYRISTLSEPTSSTNSGSAGGFTGFTDFIYEVLVGWYNSFISFLFGKTS